MLDIYDRESILEHAEEFEKFFEQPKRKYEVSDKFNLTRAETELLLEVLGDGDYIRNTTAGWRWR